MTRYFISSASNKVGDVTVKDDGDDASLIKVTMYPVAPNPDKLPPKSPHGIATEWLVQHPTLPVLLALTSYGNTRAAHLSLFDISDTELSKLTVEASTGGRQACFATFAPTRSGSSDDDDGNDGNDNKVTLAVIHHNDGLVSFFQFPSTKVPDTLMDQPALTVELPEVVPGTKKTLNTHDKKIISIPGGHHMVYAPTGKWCWVVDPNQAVVFTYATDPATGLPTTTPAGEAQFTFHCHTDAPPHGWLVGLVGKVMGLSCRPRRIAMSAQQDYCYISYETRNVIQVYAVNPVTGQIDPNGKGFLQEVSTLSEESQHQKVVGGSLQSTAELQVVGNSLFVSNRGMKVVAGKVENSIQVWQIRDGGRLAHNPQTVLCSGPVRHFSVVQEKDTELLIAGTASPAGSLQTFRRPLPTKANNNNEDEEPAPLFELVGEADVGCDVFCVLPASATKGN